MIDGLEIAHDFGRNGLGCCRAGLFGRGPGWHSVVNKVSEVGLFIVGVWHLDFVARSIFKVDAVADNPAVDLQGRGKGGGEDRVA